jgi:hypothetical protein
MISRELCQSPISSPIKLPVFRISCVNLRRAESISARRNSGLVQSAALMDGASHALSPARGCNMEMMTRTPNYTRNYGHGKCNFAGISRTLMAEAQLNQVLAQRPIGDSRFGAILTRGGGKPRMGRQKDVPICRCDALSAVATRRSKHRSCASVTPSNVLRRGFRRSPAAPPAAARKTSGTSMRCSSGSRACSATFGARSIRMALWLWHVRHSWRIR